MTRETVLNRKEYEVGVAWQVDVTVVTDHPVICISLLIPSLYSVPPTRQDLNVELQCGQTANTRLASLSGGVIKL